MKLLIKDKLTNADVFIIGVLIVIALSVIGYLSIGKTYDKYYVEVTYNGDVVDYFELTDDLDFEVEYRFSGYNKMRVKDGYIDMIEADCPDKIDVLMAPINYESWNRTIICAPNRLVVKIVGGEQAIDAIV